MNRKIYIAIIIVFTVVISGYIVSINKEDSPLKIQAASKEEALSTDLGKLISQEAPELRIKQTGGSYYPATEAFTERLLAELKNYSLEEGQQDAGKNSDVVLSFKGYQNINLNSKEGYFWFENEQQVYRITGWSSVLWDRYVLKEIDGQITYYSFEKDILGRSFINLYQETEADKVLLYYDGHIRLQVKDKAVTVLSYIEEDWIESLIASNQIVNQLYIKENPEDRKSLLLVGSTYSHTNKYGSTSWLSCYEYDGKELKEIWNIAKMLSSVIKVKAYDNGILTLEIKELGKELKIKLTQDEISNLDDYLKSLQLAGEKFIGKEDYEFFAAMPRYKFLDYNCDGNEELVASLYMRGGAPGITENIYFIYDFTKEGIKLVDVLPARENLKIDIN